VGAKRVRAYFIFTSIFYQDVNSDGPPGRFVLVAKGGIKMTTVYRRENESIDDTLRRFKKEVKKVGVLRDARKHEHYEKPSEIRKKKKSSPKRRRP